MTKSRSQPVVSSHARQATAAAPAPAISDSHNVPTPSYPDQLLAHLSMEMRLEFARAVKRYRGKRPYLAADVSALLDRHVSLEMLDKYCAESAEGYRPPGDVVTAVCLLVGTVAPFAALLAPLQYVPVPIAHAEATAVDLRQALLRIVQEVGEAAAELERSLANDGDVDAREAPRCRKELWDLITAAAALHARLGEVPS